MPLYAHQPGMIAGVFHRFHHSIRRARCHPEIAAGTIDRLMMASYSREPRSKIAALSGARQARVNSSHHQWIDRPGRNLRVAARSADGVVEAVDATAIIPGWWAYSGRRSGITELWKECRELVAAARGAAARPLGG